MWSGSMKLTKSNLPKKFPAGNDVGTYISFIVHNLKGGLFNDILKGLRR